MYFVYSLLLGLYVTIMLPIFAINTLRKHKPLPGARERIGRLPTSLRSDGRTTIWFHACSVGEILSIQALAAAMSVRFPDARLVFSTITAGGRSIAEERFGKYGPGNAFYFPIDEPLFVNRVLNFLKPDILVVVDTEIWPNTVRLCHARGIPVALVNGRISPRSFKRYKMIAPMLGRVFRNYSALLMQSEFDATRIRDLGASPTLVKVSGNIKYDRDSLVNEVSEIKRDALSKAFGLQRGVGRVIVVGSTHDPEEDVLFTVLTRLRENPDFADVRMMIAPRHAERFAAVHNLAVKHGFTVCRRSDNAPLQGAQVLLIDTLGELAAAYQFADIAFVGGTLVPHGGQSIMEPAIYGKAIVIGRSMENFPNIVKDFQAVGALIQVQALPDDRAAQVEQVYEAFAALLVNEERRRSMGDAARSLFEKSSGATAYTADALSSLVRQPLSVYQPQQ